MNKAIPQVMVTIAILFLPFLDLFAGEEKTASGGSTILITAAQIEKMKTHTMVEMMELVPMKISVRKQKKSLMLP